MRKLVRTFILTAAAAASLAGTTASAAISTIDTTGGWDGSSVVGALGSPSTGVIGQTFTAPDTQMNSFTFIINDFDRQVEVYAAIYEWTGDLIAGNGPQGATGAALFSTDWFFTSGTRGLTPLTIDTLATPLVVGKNYVALLAARSSAEGEIFFGAFNPITVIANNGGFNYFNNDFLLPVNNGDWDSGLDLGTLAWVGEFGTADPIPEPQSWALMMIGFGTMGVVLRRRNTAVVAA
jgi:hypothetical protein